MTPPRETVDKLVADVAEDGAPQSAVDRVREIAEVIAPHLPESDDVVKRAALYDATDGGWSIVVQSVATNRRVSIYVYGSSYCVSSYCLDEDNRRALEGETDLVKLVKWCVGRTR